MGQKSKRIFILDKAYKNFVPGRSRLKHQSFDLSEKPTLKGWGCGTTAVLGWWLMTILIALLLITITIDPQQTSTWQDRVFFGFGLGGTLVFMMYGAVTGTLSHYRNFVATNNFWKLRREGNLIMGEIVDIVREEKHGFHGAYNLVVTYQFETPDGRLLTRTMKKERHDLRNKELPGKGTAVMVLYADDSAVMML